MAGKYAKARHIYSCDYGRLHTDCNCVQPLSALQSIQSIQQRLQMPTMMLGAHHSDQTYNRQPCTDCRCGQTRMQISHSESQLYSSRSIPSGFQNSPYIDLTNGGYQQYSNNNNQHILAENGNNTDFCLNNNNNGQALQLVGPKDLTGNLQNSSETDAVSLNPYFLKNSP